MQWFARIISPCPCPGASDPDNGPFTHLQNLVINLKLASTFDNDIDFFVFAMRVITVDGQSFSGADALIFLARRIWWAWPLAVVALIPGVRSLLRRAYGYYASRRCVDECRQRTAPARERKPVL